MKNIDVERYTEMMGEDAAEAMCSGCNAMVYDRSTGCTECVSDCGGDFSDPLCERAGTWQKIAACIERSLNMIRVSIEAAAID